MKRIIYCACFGCFIATAAPSVQVKSDGQIERASVERDSSGGHILKLPKVWHQWFSGKPEPQQKHIERAFMMSHKNALKAESFDLEAVRADGVVEVTFGFQVSGDFRHIVRVADHPKEFNSWLFEGINQKPDGGDYFVSLFPFSKLERAAGAEFCADSQAAPKSPSFLLELPYEFHFMAISKTSSTKIQLWCGQSTPDWKVWKVINLPGGLLDGADTDFILFTPNGQIAYGTGVTRLKLKQWVYELVPLKLIESQGRERLGIILKNMERYSKGAPLTK